MRVCKECKLEKEISDYPLKPNGKVKSSYCKKCYNEVYYHMNRERVDEYRKKYYQKKQR
jgi:hypothetical protein